MKGDKMDDVVRDATMMGLSAIEPLITEHTVAHLKPGRTPERWRRIAIASAKQCGRAVVPVTLLRTRKWRRLTPARRAAEMVDGITCPPSRPCGG